MATLSRRTLNVRALLEGGANPNIADDFGLTPLLVAARDGQVETARLLLQHGADTRHVDRVGQGVEHYLNWHPAAVVLPEGSRAASIGTDPTPEELAALDAAHEAIRALIAAR
jgi:ankyrin repeat protein